MGEKLDVSSDTNKVSQLIDLLTVNDDKFKTYKISKNNLLFIETAKTLIYERKPELRVRLYKNIKTSINKFNQQRRRVYMNLYLNITRKYIIIL